MPIYEYKCEKCGYTFEVFTDYSHNGSRRCPECKALAKRIISAPGVIFKGSGFYSTDHHNSHSSGSSSGSGKDITPKKDSGKEDKTTSSSKPEDSD